MSFDARNLRPVNLIVVRHGQTQANLEGWVMAQRFDLPLNEKGMADAVTVADSLAKDEMVNKPGLTIWQSPLKNIATGKYFEAKNLQHFAFHLTYEDGWWPYAKFLS